jgi:pantothenate kinase
VGRPPVLDRARVVRRVRERAAAHPRVLVGVTGPPGAGKSTFAERLAGELSAAGLPAVHVPMDGFHLANAVLDRLGRRDRKGAPDTFDADGYVALLRRLRDEPWRTVYAPRFHREIEESFAAEIAVDPQVRVVVTEGNYLLLDSGGWEPVRGLLDEVWYLLLPEERRLDRLVRRHQAGGRSPEQARAWAYGNDQRNADLVAATLPRADALVAVD